MFGEEACKRGFAAWFLVLGELSKLISRCAAAWAEGFSEAAVALAAVCRASGCARIAGLLLGPGHSAEEFRRRAGLRSRGRKSCARVRIDGLLIDPSS